jgi:eukaryotic-like serine/threonine-protein kinase
MSDAIASPPLSAADARLIDHTCDRFEAAWKTGQRPDPAEFLGAAAGPVRAALLHQLLLLDWEYRRLAADDPCAADYHTRFPGDTAVVADVSREMAAPAEQSAARPRDSGPADHPAERGRPAAGADRYELVEEVGSGGIGVVYRSRDGLLGRELAVKVLRESYRDNPDVRHRFIEEARVGSQLQHPAIVPVYDLGWLPDHRPYFTMRLVEGETLAALLRARPDPARDLPRWLGVFCQVCQAVAYSHTRGVVHRDLKPSNVMVGAFGEVQVMDWGFAKILGAEEQRTERPPEANRSAPVRGHTAASHSGDLMGTPAYMPPEQARGETTMIDARADVFALGAILCEILTGAPPYVAENPHETCRRAAAGDVGDAYARLDACGADETLRSLANRCLAAAREDRPPDAGVVAREVAAHLTSAEERARRAGLERAAAEVRAQEAQAKAKAERRARRLTLALALSLAAGVGAVAAVQARADRDRAAAAADRATRAAAATAGVEAAAREARGRADEAWGATDYPDRMQRATDAAVAAFRRADDSAASGLPGEAALTELASARRLVDDLVRHTRLIAAHAGSRQKYANESGNRIPGGNYYTPVADLCNRHDEALRQFGLDPIDGNPDEVVRAVAASRIRDSLLGMLAEWHSHAGTLSATRVSGLRVSPAVARDRLARVIRSARQLSGGAYAKWQDLRDRDDVPGLVAFATSPESLNFRPTLLGALGADLLRAKQHAACQTFLRAAVDRHPHDVWLHYDLYLACRDARPSDDVGALRHLSAASARLHDSPMFHQRLGTCYAALGSRDQSVAAFRKAIALDPDSSSAHTALGYALRGKNAWDGAVAAFREAVRLSPNDGRAMVGLIEVLAAAGMHAEALDAPLETVRQHPTLARPQSLFRLNTAALVMGCVTSGAGGKDLPPAVRPAYRNRALELLTTDLAEIRKLGAADRQFVHETMKRWLGRFEFKSVLDPAAVGQLPPAERDAWNKLWADVRDLRDRTAPDTGRNEKK